MLYIKLQKQYHVQLLFIKENHYYQCSQIYNKLLHSPIITQATKLVSLYLPVGGN